MVRTVYTAKNGARYIKLANGQCRFISGASKSYLNKIRSMKGGHKGPCALSKKGRCAKSKTAGPGCEVSPKGRCRKVSGAAAAGASAAAPKPKRKVQKPAGPKPSRAPAPAPAPAYEEDTDSESEDELNHPLIPVLKATIATLTDADGERIENMLQNGLDGDDKFVAEQYLWDGHIPAHAYIRRGGEDVGTNWDIVKRDYMDKHDGRYFEDLWISIDPRKMTFREYMSEQLDMIEDDLNRTGDMETAAEQLEDMQRFLNLRN